MFCNADLRRKCETMPFNVVHDAVILSAAAAGRQQCGSACDVYSVRPQESFTSTSHAVETLYHLGSFYNKIGKTTVSEQHLY